MIWRWASPFFGFLASEQELLWGSEEYGIGDGGGAGGGGSGDGTSDQIDNDDYAECIKDNEWRFYDAKL